MVVSMMLGKRVTPEDIVNWCGNKYYISGTGTGWDIFAAGAEHYNLNCNVISTKNINLVVENMKEGDLVISSQGPGLFTSYGHFIVLWKINSTGGISVMDPNKRNAIGKGYNSRIFTQQEINRAAKNYFIFDRR